jgi:urease accessory protein
MMKDNSISESANTLAQLRLLHIADSALPIGSAAHSFGLETLVDSGDLAVTDLEAMFSALLQETGLLEATYCRAAHALGKDAPSLNFATDWIALNARLAALKPAREPCRQRHTWTPPATTRLQPGTCPSVGDRYSIGA